MVIFYLLIQLGQYVDDCMINLFIQILFVIGLFFDVQIQDDGEFVIVCVQENLIINCVVLEGNCVMVDDKIMDEIQVQLCVIFICVCVQFDVQCIIEVYCCLGCFVVLVMLQIIEFLQNCVDLIFEIFEGLVIGVSWINFIGNESFIDCWLCCELVMEELCWWCFFSLNDNYDLDCLEYDCELLC